MIAIDIHDSLQLPKVTNSISLHTNKEKISMSDNVGTCKQLEKRHFVFCYFWFISAHLLDVIKLCHRSR
jgi:hypothetical protein